MDDDIEEYADIHRMARNGYDKAQPTCVDWALVIKLAEGVGFEPTGASVRGSSVRQSS